MACKELVQRLEAGDVVCALWKKRLMVDGRGQIIISATVDARYRDNQGQWRVSQSLVRDEIPLAIFVLHLAFEYLNNETEAVEAETETVM